MRLRNGRFCQRSRRHSFCVGLLRQKAHQCPHPQPPYLRSGMRRLRVCALRIYISCRMLDCLRAAARRSQKKARPLASLLLRSLLAHPRTLSFQKSAGTSCCQAAAARQGRGVLRSQFQPHDRSIVRGAIAARPPSSARRRSHLRCVDGRDVCCLLFSWLASPRSKPAHATDHDHASSPFDQREREKLAAFAACACRLSADAQDMIYAGGGARRRRGGPARGGGCRLSTCLSARFPSVRPDGRWSRTHLPPVSKL